jgi:hypothetical protein
VAVGEFPFRHSETPEVPFLNCRLFTLGERPGGSVRQSVDSPVAARTISELSLHAHREQRVARPEWQTHLLHRVVRSSFGF